jgi:hypothetical protein
MTTGAPSLTEQLMNSIKCTSCGHLNFATDATCKGCGAALTPGATDAFKQTFGGQSAPGGGYRTAVGAYYRESGAVTVAGLAAGIGGGLVVAVVLAFVYSYLNLYSPLVFLNVICTVGYAIALGVSVAFLFKWGKTRNSTVGMFVATVVTLASYYLSWVIWLSIVITGEDFSISSLTLAADPLHLWEILQAVNERGVWTIGGHGSSSSNKEPVSGLLLWLCWGGEALIVLGGATKAAWAVLSAHPFCESCLTWCAEEQGVASIRATESEEIKRRFEAKDFMYMKTVGPMERGDLDWYRVDLHRCPGCGRTNTLTVQLSTLKTDRKGKQSVDSKDVIRDLLLSEGDVHQLRRVCAELTQPPPPVVAA